MAYNGLIIDCHYNIILFQILSTFDTQSLIQINVTIYFRLNLFRFMGSDFGCLFVIILPLAFYSGLLLPVVGVMFYLIDNEHIILYTVPI